MVYETIGLSLFWYNVDVVWKINRPKSSALEVVLIGVRQRELINDSLFEI